MSDISIIDTIPIELFLKLLSYMKGKDVMNCRVVCNRWKEIIDELTQSEFFWKKRCEKDFALIIQIARNRCRSGMQWSDLYRSLSLWSKLKDATDEQDEFCGANSVEEEIQGFEILPNGTIGVHKRASIVYYDVQSYKPARISPLRGEYSRYTENDHILAILSTHLSLSVIYKTYMIKPQFPISILVDDVVFHLLLDDCLYYVTANYDLYIVTFKDRSLKKKFVTHCNEGALALGYKDHKLRLLTFERKVFILIDKKFVFVELLGTTQNLLHQLHNHNLLELLDWRIYFQWLFVLNHSIPQGPLQDIITIRSYGNVFFVGSTWGVLRIYYEPFIDGEFDLFKAKPVKQYNFMERSDCPVLLMCPILKIDVYEIDNGHKVLVAMPKKIAIITFTHNIIKTQTAPVKCRDKPDPPGLSDQMEKIKMMSLE